MRKLRALIEGPYGRWLMLGLLLFILVIFTVTAEIEDWIRGAFEDRGPSRDDVAGTFAVLPGSKVEVTWKEYDSARNRYGLAAYFLTGQPPDRVGTIDVWTYMILLEAAKREGITVPPGDVVEILKQRVRPNIWADPQRYKEWVRTNFRTSAAALELAVRDLMVTFRVRDLYNESYGVAPATTREKAIADFASQNLEYVRCHVAALPAALFLQEAEDALAKEEDPEAKLEDFYAKDPALKAEVDQFRIQRRYKLEVLYTIHEIVTEESYARLEALFQKTWPDLDVSKLEPSEKEAKDFYGLYQDRLLEDAGTSRKELREKELEGRSGKEDEPAGEEPGEGESTDEEPKEGEGAPPEEPEEDEASPEDDSAELREAIYERGYEIVADQVRRELKVRGMFQWFHDVARRAGEKTSLKKLFDQLRKHDDPESAVCSAEIGKGLLVYLDFDGKHLTGEEIEEIEDRGVKFTHNFRLRVSQVGDTDLPKLSKKADVLGGAGHGRQIFRLLDVKRPSRKTFEDLTEGEKEDLREDWYLPATARELAENALAELRTRLVEGEIEPEAFRKEATELGCRFHADEWIEASRDFLAEPDKSMYWPDAYEHMRDRHFLHGELASVLGRDRVKKELTAGSFPEVLVDARRGEDDPGTAYLVQILERRKPDASMVPPDELQLFLNYARTSKQNAQQKRWTEKVEQLLSDFNVVFMDEMNRRVQDELERRAEAKRRGRSRP